jgi:hypothetical protein
MVSSIEGKRTFELEGAGTYIVETPDANSIRESDWCYSRTYSKALVEGITTSGEMMDILKRRGITGPTFDKKATDLREKIAEKIIVMEQELDRERRKTLATEVSSLREDLFQLNQRVNGPMSQTCEQMAEDSRLEHLTSCLVRKVDGSRVWDSYEAFLAEPNRIIAWRARLEVMLFLQGLDSNFLEKSPENVALREIEEEKVAEAEAAEEKRIADEEAKVEVEVPDESPVVEEPLVVKKPRRSKKTE